MLVQPALATPANHCRLAPAVSPSSASVRTARAICCCTSAKVSAGQLLRTAAVVDQQIPDFVALFLAQIVQVQFDGEPLTSPIDELFAVIAFWPPASCVVKSYSPASTGNSTSFRRRPVRPFAGSVP